MPQPTAINTLQTSYANQRWSIVINCLMFILLVFAPLAFGTVQPWSQQLALVLISLMALCVAGRSLADPQARFVWSWTYIPIAVFLGLTVMQVVPLPRALVSLVSPETVSLKDDLLSDLGGAGDRLTLSFYSHATVSQLRPLLGVVVLFIVVLNSYAQPHQIKRLLAMVAVSGAVVALMAMQQNLSGNSLIYGLVPMISRNSGPFMNSSHFGQFMNLSLGCGLGLLFVQLGEERRLSSILQITGQWRNTRVRIMGGLTMFVVLGAATVFLSMTRGGMISLMAAGSAVALLMTWRFGHSGKVATLVAIGIAVLAMLLLVGFDPIYDRVATLREVETAQGGRLEIIQDMATSWAQFPLVGTGLGTFQYVFSMFDRSDFLSLVTHAENEYAQLMFETGAIGVACGAAFLVMILGAFIQAVWSPRQAIQMAGFGLGFGLLAVLLHSASDFGQHIPAVAFLTAITCALLLNLAKLSTPTPSPYQGEGRGEGRATKFSLSPTSSSNLRHQMDEINESTPGTAFTTPSKLKTLTGRIIAPILIVVFSAWSAWDVSAARLADIHRTQLLGLEDSLTGREDEKTMLPRLIAHAEGVLEHEPQDIEARYRLAFYNWRTLIGDADPTDMKHNLTPEGRKKARRLLHDLAQSRRIAPTYGPSYALAGETAYFDLGDPSGAALIRQGHRLAPVDPFTAYSVGYLSATEGDYDAADQAFRRAVLLDRHLMYDVLDVYAFELEQPHRAYKFAQGNRGSLQYLASKLDKQGGHESLVSRCRAEIRHLLAVEASSADAPANVLAQFASTMMHEKDYASAIDYYRRALSQDYGQVQWRFELARALAASGDPEGAIREARLCLQLRPQLIAARHLIAEQSVLQ